MYQEERLLKILKLLDEQHSMSVNEICEHFTISRDTARRDILMLVEQGAAIRTHGGISVPSIKDSILAYRERVQSFSKEKMKIGKRALDLIEEDHVYFFDVSTTVCCLADQMSKEINVFTHSLDIAEVLSNQSKAKMFLLGGSLNIQNRYFFDMEVIHQLKKISFNGGFFGAAAIMEDGIYYEDKEDAYIKSLVAKKSSQNIILADFDKFSKRSHFKGIEWDEIQMIITNQYPPPKFLDLIQYHNIELWIAE